MTIKKTGNGNIIGKIRTAIDDIVPSGVTDSFTDDTDNELWQAVQQAVMTLLVELPIALLDPSSKTGTDGVAGNDDGSGLIVLDDDFLRFVSLKLTTWNSPVYSLIEPGSDEEMRQRTSWGRGTPDKPKVMLDHGVSSSATKKVLKYWTAGKANGQYSHIIDRLYYILVPDMSEDVFDCALKEAAESTLINLAASIFFEGKKEHDTAEKFKALQ